MIPFHGYIVHRIALRSQFSESIMNNNWDHGSELWIKKKITKNGGKHRFKRVGGLHLGGGTVLQYQRALEHMILGWKGQRGSSYNILVLEQEGETQKLLCFQIILTPLFKKSFRNGCQTRLKEYFLKPFLRF